MLNNIFEYAQMDARTLAMEISPVIIWQEGRRPEIYEEYWSKHSPKDDSKNSNFPTTFSAWDLLSGEMIWSVPYVCVTTVDDRIAYEK